MKGSRSVRHVCDLVSVARLPHLSSSLLAIQPRPSTRGGRAHKERLDGRSPRSAIARWQVAERVVVVGRHRRRPSSRMMETVLQIWRGHLRATASSIALKVQPRKSSRYGARNYRRNQRLQLSKRGDSPRRCRDPWDVQSSVGVHRLHLWRAATLRSLGVLIFIIPSSAHRNREKSFPHPGLQAHLELSGILHGMRWTTPYSLWWPGFHPSWTWAPPWQPLRQMAGCP